MGAWQGNSFVGPWGAFPLHTIAHRMIGQTKTPVVTARPMELRGHHWPGLPSPGPHPPIPPGGLQGPSELPLAREEMGMGHWEGRIQCIVILMLVQ